MFLSLPMAAFSCYSLILDTEGKRVCVCVTGGTETEEKILWYISGQIYWRLCIVNVAGAFRLHANLQLPSTPLLRWGFFCVCVWKTPHTHTQHSVKAAKMLQNFLWIFCQESVCVLSLTASKKWWKKFATHNKQQKIVYWTIGHTVTTNTYQYFWLWLWSETLSTAKNTYIWRVNQAQNL